MSEPERQVILKWMTRTEMVRKWVIDIDKIIIEYGDVPLHWNEKIHGRGITFKSNANEVNSNGNNAIAFVDFVINRHTITSDLFSFEYEFPQFKHAFEFGFVQGSMDKDTGEIQIDQIDSQDLNGWLSQWKKELAGVYGIYSVNHMTGRSLHWVPTHGIACHCPSPIQLKKFVME